MQGKLEIFLALGNKLKTLLIIAIGIAVILGSIAAIVAVSLNLTKELDKPCVTLSDNVASWENNESAVEWEIRLNGECSRINKDITSVILENGDVFSVRAIGVWGITKSDWSDDVTYKYTVNETYTVTWKNFDGTVIKTDKDVPFGIVPQYVGEAPVREADARYTYVFCKWTPDVAAVVSDVTYTAIFSEIPNTYTVEFYSDDGTELFDAVTVSYGSSAVYAKAEPEKASTASHCYSFEKWVDSPMGTAEADLTAVVESMKVYASFSCELKRFSVTVLSSNADFGSVSENVILNVPYGAEITAVGNSVLVNGVCVLATANSDNAEYSYSFVGWSLNERSVTADTTVTAKFERSRKTYRVTWKNIDGTVLEIDDVKYGDLPTYNGEAPKYPYSPEVLYEFKGSWTPSVTAVTEDTEYVAQYERNEKLRIVTFYDCDGETVLNTLIVTSGASAEYPGNLPLKQSDIAKNYTFDKWVTEKGGSIAAELNSVTSDMSVYASYKTSAREYTVIFKHSGGEVFNSATVSYGEAANALAYTPLKTGYSLSPWNTAPDGRGKSFERVANPDEALFSEATNETVTLYAYWKANEYKVIYNVNKPERASGVINGVPEDSLWTYDSDSVLASEPYLVGWSFCGWYLDLECMVLAGDGDEHLTKPNYATEGEVILYAKWMPNYYTVSYDSNGGEGSVEQSQHVYDSKSPLSQNGFSREDHIFLGWSEASDAVRPTYRDGEIVSAVSEKDVTLYAVWLKTKETVTYTDERTVMKENPYSETVDPNMNVEALSALGYTHIKITVTFYAKRTEKGSKMESSAEIILSNSSYKIVDKKLLEFGELCEESGHCEGLISDFDESGSVLFNCFVSGNPVSTSDGWILGERTVTFEAIKK